VIVEDDFDHRRCGVGDVEQTEEFDKFATAVAILDQGVHLAGQEVDAGHQGDRSVPLVLVIAADRRMGGWHRAQVGGGRADRLDAGFLIVSALPAVAQTPGAAEIIGPIATNSSASFFIARFSSHSACSRRIHHAR
jgi:hypothetical protein